MRATEWLSIAGLVLAGDAPPEPGSVIIDLSGGGPDPKLGVVIGTAGGRSAIIQLNRWWQETEPLHVHPWENEDVDLMLTGLVARLEFSTVQESDDVMDGRGVLTIGTGGARLHCSNVRSPRGMGSRMIINPHSWALGAGVDSPRHGTRSWRIVADTPTGTIVLCDGKSLGTMAEGAKS